MPSLAALVATTPRFVNTLASQVGDDQLPEFLEILKQLSSAQLYTLQELKRCLESGTGLEFLSSTQQTFLQQTFHRYQSHQKAMTEALIRFDQVVEFQAWVDRVYNPIVPKPRGTRLSTQVWLLKFAESLTDEDAVFPDPDQYSLTDWLVKYADVLNDHLSELNGWLLDSSDFDHWSASEIGSYRWLYGTKLQPPELDAVTIEQVKALFDPADLPQVQTPWEWKLPPDVTVADILAQCKQCGIRLSKSEQKALNVLLDTPFELRILTHHCASEMWTYRLRHAWKTTAFDQVSSEVWRSLYNKGLIQISRSWESLQSCDVLDTTKTTVEVCDRISLSDLTQIQPPKRTLTRYLPDYRSLIVESAESSSSS